MRAKIIYCLNFLWAGFCAFTFPIAFEVIYLDITGHSKGYGYDLGSERDVSVMIGVFEMIIWLALALPSGIYVFRKTAERGRKYLMIPGFIYPALALLCVILLGGVRAYAGEVFGL